MQPTCKRNYKMDLNVSKITEKVGMEDRMVDESMKNSIIQNPNSGSLSKQTASRN